MIDQLMSSIFAGQDATSGKDGKKVGSGGGGGDGGGPGSLTIPMSSSATSSAWSRSGSRNKRVNVNFGGSSGLDTHDPADGLFGRPVGINTYLLIGIGVVAVVMMTRT